MLSNIELAYIIRKVHAKVDKGNPETIKSDVTILYNIGILPNMHVGKADEFEKLEIEAKTSKGKEDEYDRMVMEWYAGSILDIVYDESWFAVNSWLNMLDSCVKLNPSDAEIRSSKICKLLNE